jgi:hypothetical protein
VIADCNPQDVEGSDAVLYNLCVGGPRPVRVRHAMEDSMIGNILRLAVVAALQLLLATGIARAQSPPPETLAAARELVETMHLDDQLKAILPAVIKNMKASVVQGRAEVEREYDALAPIIANGFQARSSEIVEAAVIVYARNFSPDDLRALNQFYKSEVGQRLLQKTPTVTQELMLAGNKFGQSVAVDIRQRMIEELRKKGINL